ncbi:MAG: ATPase, T2SS/T4P/T4SS family [Candidatus Anstonellales archaeon]
MNSSWRVLEGGDIKLDTVQLSKDEYLFIQDFLQDLIVRENIDHGRIGVLLDDFAAKNRVMLKPVQRDRMIRYIDKFYLGLGYLEDILKMSNVEEIAVIGLNKPIYIYQGGWKSTNVAISSREYFIDLVNRLAHKSNRRITLRNPRLNASLENYRIHASIDPVSECEMTIRILRKDRLSYLDFIDKAVYPKELIAYLALIMLTDSSVIIAGNTGSGKTSFLNSLLSFIPYGDRIVIVEETPEIRIDHPQQVRLVENADLGISFRDLVYDTLRMRSDRTIVGEVRKPDEVKAFIDVVLSGQARGTYATFHAHSSRELVSRMLSYGVSKSDIEAIDFIIIQKRLLREVDNRLVELRRGIEMIYVPENRVLFKLDSGIDHEGIIQILKEKLYIDQTWIEYKYNRILDFISNRRGDFSKLFLEYQREILGYDI